MLSDDGLYNIHPEESSKGCSLHDEVNSPIMRMVIQARFNIQSGNGQAYS